MTNPAGNGKTVLMVSALTQNIRSLTGHTIFFKKNTPTEVPIAAVDECLAKGCAPIDQEEVEALNAARDAQMQQETAQLERIIEGITKLVLKASPSDFTAGGRPSDRALEKLLGEKITADQRDMAWRLWRDRNRQAELEDIVNAEAAKNLEKAKAEQGELDSDELEMNAGEEVAEEEAKPKKSTRKKAQPAAPAASSDDSGSADEDGDAIPGG